jgi:hypothetical protein
VFESGRRGAVEEVPAGLRDEQKRNNTTRLALRVLVHEIGATLPGRGIRTLTVTRGAGC